MPPNVYTSMNWGAPVPPNHFQEGGFKDIEGLIFPAGFVNTPTAEKAAQMNKLALVRDVNGNAVDLNTFGPKYGSSAEPGDTNKTVVDLFGPMVTVRTGVKGISGEAKLSRFAQEVLAFDGFNIAPEEIKAFSEAAVEVIIPDFRSSTQRSRPSGEISFRQMTISYKHRHINTSPILHIPAFKTMSGAAILAEVRTGMSKRLFEYMIKDAMGLIMNQRSVFSTIYSPSANIHFDQSYTTIAHSLGLLNKGNWLNCVSTLQKIMELTTEQAESEVPQNIITSDRALTVALTKSVNNLVGEKIGNWAGEEGLTTGKAVTKPRFYSVPIKGDENDETSCILDQRFNTFVSGSVPLDGEEVPLTYKRLFSGYAGGQVHPIPVSDLVEASSGTNDPNYSTVGRSITDPGFKKFYNDDKVTENQNTSVFFDKDGGKVGVLGDIKPSIFNITRVNNSVNSAKKVVGEKLFGEADMAISRLTTLLEKFGRNGNNTTHTSEKSAVHFVPGTGLWSETGAGAAAGAGLVHYSPEQLQALLATTSSRKLQSEHTAELTEATRIATAEHAAAVAAAVVAAAGAAPGAAPGVMAATRVEDLRAKMAAIDALRNNSALIIDTRTAATFKDILSGKGLYSWTGLNLYAEFIKPLPQYASEYNQLISDMRAFSRFCNHVNSLCDDPVTKEMDPIGTYTTPEVIAAGAIPPFDHRCIENVYMAFLLQDTVAAWVTDSPDHTGSGYLDTSSEPIITLSQPSSKLIRELRAVGFAAVTDAAVSRYQTTVRASISANFVGGQPGVIVGGGVGGAGDLWEVGHVLTLLVMTQAKLTSKNDINPYSALINRYAVEAYSGAAAPALPSNEVLQDIGYRFIREMQAIGGAGLSPEVVTRLTGVFRGIANAMWYQLRTLQVDTMGIRDPGGAAGAGPNTFSVSGWAYNKKHVAFPAAGAVSTVRPSNALDISAIAPTVIAAQQQAVYGNSRSDYYIGLLTGTLLKRDSFTAANNADFEANPAAASVGTVSSGGIISRAKEFTLSSSFGASALITVAIMYTKVNSNTLSRLVANGISIPFSIMVFHPVSFRADPLAWVPTKEFVTLCTIEDAFVDVNFFNREYRPVISAHIVSLAKHSTRSYWLDGAYIYAIDDTDRVEPAKDDMFTSPKNAGWISVLTSPVSSKASFPSLLGMNAIPGMFDKIDFYSENDHAHHDMISSIVSRFSITESTIAGATPGLDEEGEASLSTDRLVWDFNSKPGTFDLIYKGGKIVSKKSHYLFGQCPMEDGSLNDYVSCARVVS